MEEILPSQGCLHHWIIATPNGVTSRGVCKRCGVERQFPNAGDDALIQKTVVGMYERPKEAKP